MKSEKTTHLNALSTIGIVALVPALTIASFFLINTEAAEISRLKPDGFLPISENVDRNGSRYRVYAGPVNYYEAGLFRACTKEKCPTENLPATKSTSTLSWLFGVREAIATSVTSTLWVQYTADSGGSFTTERALTSATNVVSGGGVQQMQLEMTVNPANSGDTTRRRIKRNGFAFDVSSLAGLTVNAGTLNLYVSSTNDQGWPAIDSQMQSSYIAATDYASGSLTTGAIGYSQFADTLYTGKLSFATATPAAFNALSLTAAGIADLQGHINDTSEFNLFVRTGWDIEGNNPDSSALKQGIATFNINPNGVTNGTYLDLTAAEATTTDPYLAISWPTAGTYAAPFFTPVTVDLFGTDASGTLRIHVVKDGVDSSCKVPAGASSPAFAGQYTCNYTLDEEGLYSIYATFKQTGFATSTSDEVAVRIFNGASSSTAQTIREEFCQDVGNATSSGFWNQTATDFGNGIARGLCSSFALLFVPGQLQVPSFDFENRKPFSYLYEVTDTFQSVITNGTSTQSFSVTLPGLKDRPINLSVSSESLRTGFASGALAAVKPFNDFLLWSFVLLYNLGLGVAALLFLV